MQKRRHSRGITHFVFFVFFHTNPSICKWHIYIAHIYIYIAQNFYAMTSVCVWSLNGAVISQTMAVTPQDHQASPARGTDGNRPNYATVNWLPSAVTCLILNLGLPNTCGPFYQHGLTSIGWISNYIIYRMWGEITSFPNFYGATTEIRECISNYILHFINDKITYLCWDLSYIMLVKGVEEVLQDLIKYHWAFWIMFQDQWKYIRNYQCPKITCVVVSTVVADVLAPLGARTSATTVMTINVLCGDM